MSSYPKPVANFVLKLTTDVRRIAFLRLALDGTLIEAGGALHAYGFFELKPGAAVGTQVLFLEGMLPLQQSPEFLPYVTTDTGIAADIYLFTSEAETWVVLLDATVDARKRQVIQQHAHDLGLKVEQQERVEERLIDEKDELETLVESRTRSLAHANYQLIQEIDERRRTAEALQQSEARFRRVSESNIIGIIFWDLSGTVTEANEAFLEAIGYGRADLLAGKIKWDNITLPELRHMDEQAIEEMRARGACTPFEKTFIRKDGTRTMLVFGAALLEGSQQQTVCYTLDVSRWK